MPTGVYVRTDIYREKQRLAHKGQESWSKGLTKDTDPRVMQISLSSLGKHKPNPVRLFGMSNKLWKGNAICPRRIHIWLVSTYGKPMKCVINPEHTGRFVWASITGHNYTRELSDYAQLCSSCHKRFDSGKEKRITLQEILEAIRVNNKA